MNWKETVMSNEEISCHCDQIGLARMQAEISYKAGEVEGYKRGLEMREPYQAGIKEVVEWVEGTFCGGEGIYVIYPEDWQAFKESKGVK